ncbi:MAG: DUF4391 domain-containing protein [Bacteroidaceae bacterium]|nr:DUF4391 domain-containing protein [Bacteroidaceae bacterium]
MRTNLLQYPETTLFGKTVAKKLFYDQLDVSAKMKQRFVNDIEEIVWLYKLAPTTLNVQKGEKVSEIEIMLCPLKDVDCPVDVFKFISQKIPHHIVFILQYGESYRLLIQYGQDSFVSPWCKQEELSLKIEGQTLDRIYDSFVGQLTGIGNRDSESLQEIIRLKKEIKKLSEKIETMQRQIRREPQLNRQMEMNSEARAMKQQLQELKKQLEDKI